ncbi:MAG: pyruvate kinase [Candidatus Omnitrophica bacterium]|nr:pyruvate kinase [Candidatus Omnitrophota bacterium]
MRKTKIVATVGPACRDKKNLQKLLEQGADVLRINISHTSLSDLRKWILLIREVERRIKRSVAILIDLQGPRVRTGPLKDQKQVELKAHTTVWIEIADHPGDGQVITTNCREFTQMVKPGDDVLIDNGSIHLKVISKKQTRVKCRVLRGGRLGENKGINLPHAPETLPALTRNDQDSLKVALRHKVDYVALSFVRSQRDVLTLKKWMKKFGVEVPVIAKIEKPRAVDCLEEILKVTDMIMVARGDLGIELGIEKVPAIQKKLIEAAKQYAIPVITATQMLESMMTAPNPTRAEVSDIANAVFDGTDAVMLSGETSIGEYPCESVRVMSRIAREAELHKSSLPDYSFLENEVYKGSRIHAITRAARVASKSLEAKAIVAYTHSWKTAVLISKLDPYAKVIALAPSDEIIRRMNILRGVSPIKMSFSKSTDRMFKDGARQIIRRKILKKGDPVVFVTGRKAMPSGAQYTLHLHTLGA